MNRVKCDGNNLEGCCQDVRRQLRKCITCDTFRPEDCFKPLGADLCSTVIGAPPALQAWTCHCSKCLQTIMLDKAPALLRDGQADNLVVKLQETIANAVLDLTGLRGKSMAPLVVLDGGLGFSVPQVAKFDKFRLQASMCANRLPSLEGLDPYLQFGPKECPPSATKQEGLCVTLLDGQSLSDWIATHGIAADDDTTACGFKNFVDDVPVTLRIPILANLDLYFDNDERRPISIGFIIELVLRFSLQARLGYHADLCQLYDSQAKNISLGITLSTSILPEKTKAELSPLRAKIAGVGPAVFQTNFAHKAIYTFLQLLEADMREHIEKDDFLTQCFNHILGNVNPFVCDIKVTSASADDFKLESMGSTGIGSGRVSAGTSATGFGKVVTIPNQPFKMGFSCRPPSLRSEGLSQCAEVVKTSLGRYTSTLPSRLISTLKSASINFLAGGGDAMLGIFDGSSGRSEVAPLPPPGEEPGRGGPPRVRPPSPPWRSGAGGYGDGGSCPDDLFPALGKCLPMARYAPRVYFHPDEKYYSSSVEYFLANTHIDGNNLVSNEPLRCPDCILPFFHGEKPTDLVVPPTYAFAADKGDGIIDLIYFFFYPYNRGKNVCLGGILREGSCPVPPMFGTCAIPFVNECPERAGEYKGLCIFKLQSASCPLPRILGHCPTDLIHGCVGKYQSFGNHVGDWESVVVRLINEEPKAVFLSYHQWGKLYSWRDPELEYVDDHVVGYAANGSHGMWAKPGSFVYYDMPEGADDLADDTGRGVPMDTWKNLVSLQYRPSGEYPAEVQWLKFPGRWGNRKAGCEIFEKFGECILGDAPSGLQGRGILTSKVLE